MKKEWKVMKETTKIYDVRKGSDDYRVWNRSKDFLCDYMTKKRNSPFKSIKTRRDMRVCITILELTPQNQEVRNETRTIERKL